MSFDVDIGHFSLQGPRERNEDFAAAARPAAGDATRGVIAAIADGVSGGGAGREAAQTSVMSVVGDYHSAPDTWETSVVLDRLIGAQNAWLADHNRRRQGARDGADAPLAMSTLTVLVLRGQAWMLAHVGDTRAWLLRDAQGATDCVQLTQDHAFEEAFQRNRLTRAMGLDDRVRVDFEQGELRIGDTFVLTSDGVHGVLDRTRLQALAGSHPGAQAASEAIVHAAIAAGTRDNASALVLRVNGLDASRFEDALLRGRGLPALPRRKVGDTVDGYVVTAPLADTGVHRLYQARATASGALVVLKTLHESRAHDAQERAMLLHEAWLASRVAERTPPRGEAGFVCTHEPDRPSAFYTVFDWHAGVTLEAMLEQGRRFEVGDIVEGAIAVGRALARLHRHGVIHRDIKPGNLYHGDDGLWRVLDLGAALSGSDPGALRALHAGTPSYMNPEQWGLADTAPRPADAGSDLYALGVTLYRWLTGKLPYGEIEPYQGGRFRRDPKPPSRLRPDVPIWLDHVVLKAVALDPRQRFETAEELVLALERGASRPLAALAGTPLLARHPTALWQIALGASLLFNALLIYWLLFLPR
ncbi:MAG TPA: bifunctional protein-serine/threonine kinase/phosphatase [Burkholderiaceae bacterium]|nr:bifunctional protein-serine/threonine kinase/phosphatase [Burkholderiaceae bacterium]